MHIDNVTWGTIVSVVNIIAQCIALATGLAQLHYTGKKQTVGWLIGLFGQPFWIIFEVINGQWPLVALTVVFTRKTYDNYKLWQRDDQMSVAHEGQCVCKRGV